MKEILSREESNPGYEKWNEVAATIEALAEALRLRADEYWKSIDSDDMKDAFELELTITLRKKG